MYKPYALKLLSGLKIHPETARIDDPAGAVIRWRSMLRRMFSCRRYLEADHVSRYMDIQ